MKKIFKFTIKLIIIFIIANLICICFSSTVQAKELKVAEKEIIDGGGIDNKWIATEDYKPTYDTNDRFKELGNIIIGVVQFIASFVSVIVLIILGIKYMLGSVEERAEYKKVMRPYLIGAILVFSITNILAVLNGLLTNMWK